MTHAPTERSNVPLALFGAVVVMLSYCALLFDKPMARWVAAEDGPFEYGGAICFALAGFMFLWMFFKSRAGNDFFVFRTKRNVFFALLAVVFIFAAGEEISWGQRILNIDLPETVQAENLQGELNIHNLKLFHPRDEHGMTKSGLERWLTLERLFGLFWLGFCVLTPLAFRFVAPLRRFISRLNLPVVALAVGLLFPFNYAITKVLERFTTGDDADLMWPMIEIKESTFAFLFVLVAWEFLARRRAST